MSNDNIYWDIRKPMSYNCLFNFIIGPRGAGKTYGALKYAISQYLKHKAAGEEWQFMYLRRMARELEKLTKMRGGRLFNAVKAEFPNHILKAESNILYCDGKIMGYAQELSTGSILKSDSFPAVNFIIFDEFIIDNVGTYHYLKDEINKFLDLYETIARMRNNVVVFFLSNAISIANPYFDYFRLNKPSNNDIQRFGKSKDILVQNVVVEEYVEAKKNTRFGKLLEGSDYANYAIDNNWLLDNNDFIAHKNKDCVYFVTLRYKNNWIGVWYDEEECLFYISNDVDLQYRYKYSTTTQDHKPNIALMKGTSPFIGALVNAYRNGFVRYESIKLKAWFLEIMRMTL